MRGLALRARLSYAWKILSTPFSPEGGQKAGGLLAGLLQGSAGPVPERGTLELLAAINQSPWVRACASRVADAMASLEWQLYVMKPQPGRQALHDFRYAQKAQGPLRRTILKDLRRTGELSEPVERHLFLDMMSRNSDYFSGRDVRWLGSVWYDMIGDAFAIKERNKLNKPVALWPVPPHWVVNTPTPTRPTYRFQWRGWNVELPAADVLWSCNPSPVNPYGRGSGMGRAIDDDIATDEYAAKHMAAFFKNRALPDVLVMPKEGNTFSPAERTRFEEFWNQELQGYWRAYKPLFLQNPVDVKLIEQNFRNLQLRDLRNQERDTIMQTWGIPPEMFGVVTASNRSTIEMAPFIFATYVLVPRAERQRELFQYRVLPEYDQPDLMLDYVSPVPEDRIFKLQTMQAQPTAFQLNEFRCLAGFPEDDTLDAQYAGAMAPGGGPVPPEGEEPPAEEAEPSEEDIDEAVEELEDEEVRALDRLFAKLVKRQTV